MRDLWVAALFFALNAVALPNSAEAADCTIDKATFIQPNAEGFTLTFRPAKEPNAWSDLEVTVKTPSQEFKFSMTASNGYSFNYLVPSWKDAPEDSEFRLFFYGKDYKSLELPNKGSPAPEAIFTPDVGPMIYYTKAMKVQEFLPPDMWRIGKCE